MYMYVGRPTSGRYLSESFSCFCDEVITRRIIAGGEIVKMNTLNKLFINTVRKRECIDISTYRNSQLKARLVHKFPELQYVQPKSTLCEFVFCPADEDRVHVLVGLQDSESDRFRVRE